jgi:hypothetical protein
MFNPLSPDLSQLKELDIEKSIADLSKRYAIAARGGNNQLCFQVQLILEQYKEELASRHRDRSKKINVRDQEKDIDNLINID